jgi:pimeloyl-ACP methyl ester carboxylesterase
MRSLIAALATLAILALASAVPVTGSNAATVAAQTTSIADADAAIEKTTFVYATKGGRPLQLDRYVSSDRRIQGRRPVLLYSVGGGWEKADRADRISTEYLEHFAALGYVAVSIDYRLAIAQAKQNGEMTAANLRPMYLRAIRWGVEDLYDATAYVLKHADEWNIDPARIVISGSSAGATNSLVAEFNVANQTELAAKHLPRNFRYAGAISMAGAFWLEDGTPFVWKQKPAPIMFIHGGKDQLVTYDADENNSAYGPVYAQRQFASQGYPSWFIDLPEADHVMALAGLIDYRSETEAFLTKLVREKQDLSIHTVEQGKVTKSFGNLAALYGRYLTPAVPKTTDTAKQ